MVSSKTLIAKFVSLPALALIGMSRSGKKFGNIAYRTLTSKGYLVYPIHPSASSIRGVRCYSRLAQLPVPVEGVLIVVPPTQAVNAVRDAAAAGIRLVWLQQGSASPEVLQVCRDVGVEAISGECILMYAHASGIHKAHRWVWGVLGKVPA